MSRKPALWPMPVVLAACLFVSSFAVSAETDVTQAAPEAQPSTLVAKPAVAVQAAGEQPALDVEKTVLSAQPAPALSTGGDTLDEVVSAAAIPRDPDTLPISEVHYNQLQKASPWFHSFLPGHDREYLTGNWFGLRDKLSDKGVTVSSSYVADVLGNPIGGRVKGTRYDSSLGADLNIDFGKLIELKGTQFHISGIWRAGRSLSHDCIDNQFTASSIFGSEQVRLYSLYIEQALFGDRVDIKVGRLGAGDDFASSPIYWLYVNNAIDGNPISVPINVPFATYPTATWGVCTKIKLTDRILSKTGFYNGDPAVGRDAAHGMDFTLRLHRGVFYAQEFSFLKDQLKDDKGMPGNYKVGGYYHSGRSFMDNYQDANLWSYALSGLPRREHSGDYGMYFHADQMVYREGGPGTEQGLTLFECVTLAPARITQFPFFFDAGLAYKGLLPKRDMDMTALGFAYGQWSEYISDREEEQRDILGMNVQPQYYEMMLDLSYKAQVTPCFFIQPDTQYIIHPMGRPKAKNALVIGVRVGVNF